VTVPVAVPCDGPRRRFTRTSTVTVPVEVCAGGLPSSMVPSSVERKWRQVASAVTAAISRSPVQVFRIPV
jgi:hypothetical protein